MPSNKRKIINDPIYGFVTIPNELIFTTSSTTLYFQRLWRINNSGSQTRCIPAPLPVFIMRWAPCTWCGKLSTPAPKDVNITEEEEQAALIAILLHDVGHGPFRMLWSIALFGASATKN